MNTEPAAAIVRAARTADAQAIGEIHVRSWQVAYAGQIPDSYLRELSVPDRRRRWAERLSDTSTGSGSTGSTILVVECREGVAGFAAIGPNRDASAGAELGELWSLYLHPRFWGRGLGRVLHDRALRALAEDRYRGATLWVLSTNAGARRFYERMGWRPDGRDQVGTPGRHRDPPVRYALSPANSFMMAFMKLSASH